MPDYEAITQRQQMVWSSGNFARIGVAQVIVGELLCEAVDVRPGEAVADVAAGAGNTALAAARRWAHVTASDFVPALLETARRRADAEGLALETRVADVQHLPFSDASFDVVLSTFGAMFAPDQERTASELLRVCRPGGRIGMANWVPEGVVAEMFRVTTSHAPPPPGLRPATEWGTRRRIEELFGDGLSELVLTPRRTIMRYPSVDFAVEYFRTWFGPTKVAFDSLDEAGQESLAADLSTTWAKHNQADDGTLVVAADYVEVVGVRA